MGFSKSDFPCVGLATRRYKPKARYLIGTQFNHEVSRKFCERTDELSNQKCRNFRQFVKNFDEKFYQCA